MENCNCPPNRGHYYNGKITATLQRGPVGIPLINGVPLVGDISLPQLGLRGIYYDKTENWNAQLDFIGQAGAIYIYSDYVTKTDDEGNERAIPSIKIGDGTTPLIDSPFITSSDADYIVETIVDGVITRLSDNRMLVSPEDRERWDNKVTCVVDPENSGNLILTTLSGL